MHSNFQDSPQMCFFQPNTRNLNAIGADQGMTMYKGFAAHMLYLKLCLYAHHLQKNDAWKIQKLICQKEALKNIICRNYGGVKD